MDITNEVNNFWNSIMERILETKATDVHFDCRENEVFLRIDMTLQLYTTLNPEVYKAAIFHMFKDQPERKTDLESEKGAADFAVTIGDMRFRVNVYKSFYGYDSAVRPLPKKSFSWQQMALHEKVIDLVLKSRQGLILVTGPTGSGKSSTICSMIELLNETYPYKIITAEDPIEYMFQKKKASISQREIGEQCNNFAQALKSALRQNPNVIFIGEIRDSETAKVAMHAAETGHLVFATLHTKRVFNTISTLIKMFPIEAQEEVRSAVAGNIVLIMCQRLLPKKGGGIAVARETLIQNTASANLIKQGKEKGVNNVMISGQGQGMAEWNMVMDKLKKDNIIDNHTFESFYDYSDSLKEMGETKSLVPANIKK